MTPFVSSGDCPLGPVQLAFRRQLFGKRILRERT